MRKIQLTTCATIIIGMMCACNYGEDSAISLGFENIKYIESFKETVTLTPDTVFESDTYFEDFTICDSIVFTGSGSWDIRKLPNWKSVKRIFAKGHAHGEFIQFPKVYKSSFIHENNDLYAIVYDKGNGNVFRVNVTKTLSLDSLCIEDIKHKSKKWLDRYLYIDSKEFVTREDTENFRPKKLTYFKNNKAVSNKFFEKLDAIETGSDDSNVISALENYSKGHNKIIQAYVFFNVINIIPLDEKEDAITLCFGNKGIPINEVVNKIERTRFFYEVRTYEKCFAVLCLKDTRRPTVQFYDYNGNPLKEFVLPNPATSFDIDWIDHNLYTHNVDDGNITRYKFSM